MFILSFDYGTKIIGAAIGQYITRTANPINPINVKNGIPDWKSIVYLISYWIPKIIIVGYPLNMDGSKQNFTKKTILFAKLLQKKYSINVQLHDERLTTIESKSIFFSQKKKKSIKQKSIHSLSAVLILESWLNS